MTTWTEEKLKEAEEGLRLSTGYPDDLSAEDVLGLIAEVRRLRALILENIAKDAACPWCGAFEETAHFTGCRIADHFRFPTEPKP